MSIIKYALCIIIGAAVGVGVIVTYIFLTPPLTFLYR